MARFIGRLQGSRGEVSRLGGTASGIWAVVQGWEVGVRVVGQDTDGQDAFYVYANGGSNARTSSKAIAVISLDESGALRVETPAEYDERRAKVKEAKAS